MCLLVSRCFINIIHKLKSYCKLICQLNNYCNDNHFWFQSTSLRLPLGYPSGTILSAFVMLQSRIKTGGLVHTVYYFLVLSTNNTRCYMVSEVGFKPTPLNGAVGVNYFIALSMDNLRRCNYSRSHLNESLTYAVFKVAHKFGLFIIGYAKIIKSQIQ